MPLLLNIDTATETANICISLNGECIASLKNEHQKEHASFVHAAVLELLAKSGIELTDMQAFSVTSGPGSYTGLRVGMAAAKGFCYAFSKPLITINTLEVMAKAAIEEAEDAKENYLFCPMIDARRMEVFTAIYNSQLEIILPPQALVLEKDIFNKYITDKRIFFSGSGSAKLSHVDFAPDYIFSLVKHNAAHLASLADTAFQQNKFTDITYSQPIYLKNFHQLPVEKKG